MDCPLWSRRWARTVHSGGRAESPRWGFRSGQSTVGVRRWAWLGVSGGQSMVAVQSGHGCAMQPWALALKQRSLSRPTGLRVGALGPSQRRLLLLQPMHGARLQGRELEQPRAPTGPLKRAPTVHAPRCCRPCMHSGQGLRHGRRDAREPGGQLGQDDGGRPMGGQGSGEWCVRASVTCGSPRVGQRPVPGCCCPAGRSRLTWC